jgi:hypothetical protein
MYENMNAVILREHPEQKNVSQCPFCVDVHKRAHSVATRSKE